MKKTRKISIGTQLLDITMLAPMVAASRMGKLAAKTPAAAALDLSSMAMEKANVFSQAWLGMSLSVSRSGSSALWDPWGLLRPAKPSRSNSASMLSSALHPIHAQVKRNAASLKK